MDLFKNKHVSHRESRPTIPTRDNCLLDSVKQFWQIEEASEMGVTDNDLYDQFTKSIRFKDKHYIAKPSWKQENNTYLERYKSITAT